MTPIAVFALNRPRHLQTTLEALERSFAYQGQNHPLFIFCDTPKEGASWEGVEEVRAIADRFGQLVIRPENFGFRNITEGVTQLCESDGKVIVIEDDVVVSPDFLPFIEGALRHYQDDPRLFQVSGFMYQWTKSIAHAPFFLPHAFIWGWATWQRAWKHFSWEAPGWEAFVAQSHPIFDAFGAMPFTKMLEKTMRGAWNTWDTCWMYAVYRARGLCLYPPSTLVWNSGVGTGTHGQGHTGPELGGREGYLHGDLTLEDFAQPRLGQWEYPPPHFSLEPLERLATCFAQERGKNSLKYRLKRDLKQWQVRWRKEHLSWP